MKFDELLKSNRKIAIIGTEKNAGKTVALNEFILSASRNNIRIGVTSIGWDGERLDRVTNTQKPLIFVPSNTIIATTEGCIGNSDAPLRIIDITPFRTAIGRVVLCETRTEGYVEIAGPDTGSEMKRVTDMMLRLGAEAVLIDGALSRKTQASPSLADGVVLSTGAVLSRSMEAVVERTRHIVNMLLLPSVTGHTRDLWEEASSSCISFIDREGNIIKTQYKTALGFKDKIIEEIRDEYEYIVFPGTLVNSFIKSMGGVLREKKIGIVVKDGTKVFTEPMDYRLFKKLGGKIEVIEPIRLLGVTVNPCSPEGYCFNPRVFLESMREALYPIKVFDCMQEGY